MAGIVQCIFDPTSLFSVTDLNHTCDIRDDDLSHLPVTQKENKLGAVWSTNIVSTRNSMESYYVWYFDRVHTEFLDMLCSTQQFFKHDTILMMGVWLTETILTLFRWEKALSVHQA